MSRLIERQPDRDVYDDGTIVWGTLSIDGTRTPHPMYDRVNDALGGLKTIADSTGTLTALQLSNAVRLLARAVIALIRIRLGRREAD